MAHEEMVSKLRTPPLKKGLLPRPRLAGLLRHGAGTKLTLLSAPAGFGKTALLAQWLTPMAHYRGRAMWLSLDSSDSVPATFWTSVVTALH